MNKESFDIVLQLILKSPLDKEQSELLYKAIKNRVRNVTCHNCLKLRPVYEGIYIHPNGDLSRPKQFKCNEC